MAYCVYFGVPHVITRSLTVVFDNNRSQCDNYLIKLVEMGYCMDSSIIKSFLVLAETLSFSKAADALYKTQSVLSRQISRFEKEIGVKLFNRNSKSVSLTSAGVHYAQGLKKLCDEHSCLLQESIAIQSGYTGEITIAALPGQMIHNNFVEIMRGFEQNYPKIMVNLLAYNLSEQRHLLLEQKIDLVFGTSINFKYIPELSFEVVGYAKIGIFVTKNHPLKDKDSVTFADFKDDTFILFSEYEEPNIMKAFNKHFESFDYTPKYIVAPNIATLMLWLEAERGIAILDETHVFSENQYLRFKKISELGYMEQAVIWNNRNSNPCTELFKQYVKEHVSKS